MIEVIGASKIVLDGKEAPGDLAYMWQGEGTDCERIIEYAGRLCYRSVHRFGNAPAFIQQRIAEQHFDIVEHGWASLIFSGADTAPLAWPRVNPHIVANALGDRGYLVSGNLRAWRDSLDAGLANASAGVLAKIAPKIFRLFFTPDHHHAEMHFNLSPAPVVLEPCRCAGQARVTLVATHLPETPEGISEWTMLAHASVTFLVEGVSRSLSHQFVRHRLGSFSQESQRYVDLSKGGWSAIVPPAIRDNPEAAAIMQAHWDAAEEAYRALRDLGIRKEDARFLLPNATETRFLVTMSLAGWRHFCALRAIDKAAQWEIRAVGMAILAHLADLSPIFAEMLANAPAFEMA